MKIVVIGGSGLIGTKLVDILRQRDPQRMDPYGHLLEVMIVPETGSAQP